MVDGSIGCAGIGVSTAGSQSVSATVALVKPAMRDDVAGLGLLDRLPLEAAEGQDLGDRGPARSAGRRGSAT